MIRVFFYTILIISLTACGNHVTGQAISGYTLSEPKQKQYLPDTLREISGLTAIDSVSFACIQDENGILFIYNVNEKRITQQFQFNIDGDYEGITSVNKTIYVLRSDGTLFEIANYDAPYFKIDSFATGIPAHNNEGLCYDKLNNRLLVACKGKIGKGRKFKDKRVIYGFDLTTKKLSPDPVFDFDLQKIKQAATEKKLDIPVRVKKKGKITEPIIKFRTSAICIHPVTGKLYLLSASDHLIFVFNTDGSLQEMELLDKKLFNKAEGITFFDNGDMLITNEGQDKKATLLWFSYKAN